MSFVTTTTMIPVSSQLKSLGVITDSHMCFHSHVRAVVRSCNYHTRALRHVRKHLTTETTHTIACSVISSRIDYCNSLLYWRCCCSPREAAESSKQRRQSYVISICVSARRLLNSVHRLPVQQCIKYRIAGSVGLPNWNHTFYSCVLVMTYPQQRFSIDLINIMPL